METLSTSCKISLAQYRHYQNLEADEKAMELAFHIREHWGVDVRDFEDDAEIDKLVTILFSQDAKC